MSLNKKVTDREEVSKQHQDGGAGKATPSKCYKGAAEGALWLSVMYSGKANETLTFSDFKVLRSDPQDAVLACTDTNLMFSGCVCMGGLAQLKCGDETTKLWVKCKLQSPAGVNFVGLDTKDLPTQAAGRVGLVKPRFLKLRCFLTDPASKIRRRRFSRRFRPS